MAIPKKERRNRMKKAYIAGPYTANSSERVDENVRRAEAAAWLYYLKGYAVHCPHAQTHCMHVRYNKENVVTYDDWLKVDIVWLKECDVVVFLPGWENSKGAKMEHILAQALDKEIHYLTEEKLRAVLVVESEKP
jgi:hypothetical protein